MGDSFYHSDFDASQNVDAPTTAPSTGEESLLIDNYYFSQPVPSDESSTAKVGDSFYHSDFDASQNVDAPNTTPSTGEESLLVDNYDLSHRVPSNESTDLSTLNSPYGSDKPKGYWNMQPTAPTQLAGVPHAHQVRPPYLNEQWRPQDESMYAIERSMPSMALEALSPQDTINDGHISRTSGRLYEPDLATNMPFGPSKPAGTYKYGTNASQFGSTGQQLPTSYPSSPNSLERSGSGNKRKRLGEDQWQPVDSVNNTPHSLPKPISLGGHPLTPAGEQMLSIWQQIHQRMPMEGELVALSVVTGAAERAITYWLSSNRPAPFPIPPNVPTTPTPNCISNKNTCNVKKRVSKPWNKPWVKEKPYSCLSRCGWTFTKKGDWIKHEKINFPEFTFHCPIPDCRSSFGRKDKCRDHIRKVHKTLQTHQFDLDSRRTSVVNGLNDRCGFCGYICTSWQEWYDHVGAHFENRIEGGPWTMSMWRYPWIDHAEAGHGDEGPDDGNDPDNGGSDGSGKDAEHETDDSFDGYQPQGPYRGSGAGDGGGRQSHSGGGRSGFQHMNAKHCTRSSHPPAPSALTEALRAAARTNSMPHLNQRHPKRRTKKSRDQDRLKMNHPITWPLTEEQALLKVAPGSSLRTERINPLVDLAVAGTSARDAHIAELAPYLEDKAQVMSLSSLQAKPDEASTESASALVHIVSGHMDEDFDNLNRQGSQAPLQRPDDLQLQRAGKGAERSRRVPYGSFYSNPSPQSDIQGTALANKAILKRKDDYSFLPVASPRTYRNLSRLASNENAQVPGQMCSNCDKSFKRPCDLKKHEKIHSRPWKCVNEACKYLVLGWPTEMERDRHMNGKHSKPLALYTCLHSPCVYQSERESNCEQHMQKTHGWAYAQSKNNGRGGSNIVKYGPNQSVPKSVMHQGETMEESRLNYSPEETGPQTPPELDVKLSHPPLAVDTERAMSRLMSQSWYSRRWVVQETRPTENVLIAVMGITGAGKSSFIRSFTDYMKREEKHLSAGTTTTLCGSIQARGRKIIFIDTPGFDDSYRNDADVLADIAHWLVAEYQSSRARRGILYLHPTQHAEYWSSLRHLSRSRILRADLSHIDVALATAMWREVNEVANAHCEREALLDPMFSMQLQRLSRRPAPLRYDNFRDNLIRKQRKSNTLPCPNYKSQHWKTSGDSFSLDLSQTRESRDEPPDWTIEPPRAHFDFPRQSGVDQYLPSHYGPYNAMTKPYPANVLFRDSSSQRVSIPHADSSWATGGPIGSITEILYVARIGFELSTLLYDCRGASKVQEQYESLGRDIRALSAALKQLGNMVRRDDIIAHQDVLPMVKGLFQDCKITFKDISVLIEKSQRRPIRAKRGLAWSLRNPTIDEIQMRLNFLSSSLSLFLSFLTLQATTVDSMDNVKSKIQIIYSRSRIFPAATQMTAYPLFYDRPLLPSSGEMTCTVSDIETESKVTEFADPLGNLAIYFATASDLDRYKTVMSRGFHSKSQPSRGHLQYLQLPDTQSLEALSQQARLKAGYITEQLDSDKKEEPVSSETELPTPTGGSLGRVLDVTERQFSQNGTSEAFMVSTNSCDTWIEGPFV